MVVPMIKLGDVLNLRVLAEGVETETRRWQRSLSQDNPHSPVTLVTFCSELRSIGVL